MFINFKFSKRKIISIVFLLLALFISLFLGSYHFLPIQTGEANVKQEDVKIKKLDEIKPNMLEPLDNIYIGSVGTGNGTGLTTIIPNTPISTTQNVLSYTPSSTVIPMNEYIPSPAPVPVPAPVPAPAPAPVSISPVPAPVSTPILIIPPPKVNPVYGN